MVRSSPTLSNHLYSQAIWALTEKVFQGRTNKSYHMDQVICIVSSIVNSSPSFYSQRDPKSLTYEHDSRQNSNHVKRPTNAPTLQMSIFLLQGVSKVTSGPWFGTSCYVRTPWTVVRCIHRCISAGNSLASSSTVPILNVSGRCLVNKAVMSKLSIGSQSRSLHNHMVADAPYPHFLASQCLEWNTSPISPG